MVPSQYNPKRGMPMRTTLVGGVVVLLVAVLALAVAGPVPAQGPEIVVYSARHYGQEAAFDAFTKKTGVEVQVITRADIRRFHSLEGGGEEGPAARLLA